MDGLQHQGTDVVERRERRGGEGAWDRRDGLDPQFLEPPGRGQDDPRGDDDERAGQSGQEPLEPRDSAVIEATDRTMVGTLAWGRASTAATIDRMNPWPVNSESWPSSFGS